MLRPQTAGAASGGLPSRMPLTHRTAWTGCARAAFAASARCRGRQLFEMNKEWMQ
jgi:hypothetical protein